MAGENVLNIGDVNFTKEVIESDKPVLVDFWASWCAPCRAIAPVIDALATEYKDQVKVAKLNVDDNQEVPQKYGIRSIPTLLIFKGGKVVEQLVGTGGGRAKIEEALKKAL
jgi:thioredoxin 1